ncbi:hypothetical protein ACF3NG_06795 [Aerococcaceae bacterium WGS1372]
MRFDDSVTLLVEVVEKGFLGEEVVREEKVTVPCLRTPLSHNEQMGLFGSYNLKAFKLHLDGQFDNFTNIIYRGHKRIVRELIHYNHSTVVIV